MDCSMPGFPVIHYLLEFAQTHVHPTTWSSVTPFSCPQSFPASGSFQWVSCLHQVAKVLELLHQHQSFQWIFSAGSQHGRSHPWQGHAERPDGQGESGLKGSSVWASTPKPKSVCLLSAILYSSDITGGYPRKSLFRAPVNSLLHIRRMSRFEPPLMAL